MVDGRHPFFWLAAAGGVVVLAFYIFVALVYAQYGGALARLDWSAAFDDNGWYVSEVAEGGPAEGVLQAGDRVRSIAKNGNEVAHEPESLFAAFAPGSVYTVRVERDGEEVTATLTAPGEVNTRILAFNVSFFVISAAFYVLALLLGLRRPDLWIGRIGCIAFLVEAVGFASMALDPIRPFFTGWERTVDYLVVASQPFQAVLAYHFFRSFPYSVPGRVWRVLTWFFYAVAVALVVPSVLVFHAIFEPGATRFDAVGNGSAAVMAYFTVYRVYLVWALVAGYAALRYNYRHVGEVERRRIRWVLIGSAASIIPFGTVHLVDFVLTSFGHGSIVTNQAYAPLLYIITSLFVFIPVSIGYAILKHRIFDINVVVRLGVRYLLARGVLEAVLMIPIVALVISVLENPNRTIAELLFDNTTSFVLIVGVALSLSLRSRLGEWVDRYFFRAAYDRERILVKLTEEIAGKDSIGEISRHVSGELESALHPRRLVMLFRNEEAPHLVVGYSSDASFHPDLLGDDATLIYAFEGEPGARDVNSVRAHMPERQLELLDDLGITLVVPMQGTEGQVVGLLLLGQKRSEEPYSPRDRSLLESVAAQLAIVCENAQLKTRVARDRRIRVEVLGRMESEQINLLKECPSCGTCYDSSESHCSLDESELTLTLPIERVIDDKYRLDRLIGRGGMGAVYEGTDLRLDRVVAIKVLHGRSFGDIDAIRRFRREARASARLSHPNLVRVYDYGLLGDSGAYLVLELLRGRTLRHLLLDRGVLSSEETARIFEQIFEGMEVVHAAGIVPRDLKPENVMLVEEGGRSVVKILDFGLAKLRAVDVADGPSLTAPGTIMGTFGYMAPEQLTGGDVDERCDIFAVAVMLYEALVGRRPFGARKWADLLAEISRTTVRVPGDGPEIRWLEVLFARALAEEPEDRFATMEEAHAALLPAVLASRLAPRGADAAGDDATTVRAE